MGYISVLSSNLIKQIAAGEVIERPASVVKELLENSIDAEATRIEIEIKRAGKYIKISDNGTGIHSSDINYLFEKHATSKLKTVDDLWSLTTLGFRGEALASISSISKITCNSKHRDENCGFEIKVVDGKINKKSSGISNGTTFEVDDLFYNIPAREKFLKSEQTEINHILDIVSSEALSHPNVGIKLLNNESVLVQTSGSGDLKQTIIEILGEDLKNNLIEINSKNNFVNLSGYISSLDVNRTNKKDLFTFVNSRPVKCNIFSKAVLSSYDGQLPPSRFPIIVLNLNFKPKFVDVNVHPTKKEVRYTNSSDVYSLVLHSVQDAVSNFYKEKYKEGSSYTQNTSENITDIDNSKTKNIKSFPSKENHTYHTSDFKKKYESETYTQAAFDLYKNPELTEEIKCNEATNNINNKNTETLFTVNNLRFYFTYSDKPIAHMQKVGNKTIFEVGNIYDDNFQIVACGEIFGDADFQKEFFNSLAELASNIYKIKSNNKTPIQRKIFTESMEDEKLSTSRKKPPIELLLKVWERDFWTCVYCGLQLINPNTAKEAMKTADHEYKTYINAQGEEKNIHKIEEHTATYDHFLPYSKLPQFNFDFDNLLASCRECNLKKSDSMEQNTWKPERKNNWDKPLIIGGLIFDSPLSYEKSTSSSTV